MSLFNRSLKCFNLVVETKLRPKGSSDRGKTREGKREQCIDMNKEVTERSTRIFVKTEADLGGRNSGEESN
jgi:hypothetical protein